MAHYDEEALLEYVDGISPIAGEIEAHAAGCTVCAAEIDSHRATIKLLGTEEVWVEAPPPPSRLDDVMSFAARLKREDAEAAAVCNDVLSGPSAWWPTRLRKATGGRTAGVVRELLVRMRQLLERAPNDALQVTTLAIEVANALSVTEYPSDTVITLRAQALRDHAYVLSFIGRYREAMSMAERAEALFRQTPIPDYELARLQLVKSAIFQSLERYEEAATLAASSGEIFLRFGDRKRFIDTQMYRGAILMLTKASARALDIYRSIEQEPGLAGTLTQVQLIYNIGICYSDLHQPEKACEYLARAAAEFEMLGLDVYRAKTGWALGSTLLSASRPADAVPILRQAWRELEGLGMEADAALAALNLAEALLVTGHQDDVPAICRTLLDRFTRAGMTSAAITALAFLRETVAIGQVTPAHVRHVHDFLRELPGRQAQLFASPPLASVEG